MSLKQRLLAFVAIPLLTVNAAIARLLRGLFGLRAMFAEVRENATSLNAGIDSLNTVTRSVAAESERQAETLTTPAATIEEITVCINHIADNARRPAQSAAVEHPADGTGSGNGAPWPRVLSLRG